MRHSESAERLSVLVDEAYLDRLDEVVSSLRAAGMQVEQVLASIGTVTGSAELGRVSALERLPGVSSVEHERTYQLPPPESEIQ